MSSSQLRWVLHSQPLSGAFQCLNKKRQLCLPVRRESVNQVDNNPAFCCQQVQRESACGNPYVCNIKELSLKDTGERLPSPLSFPLLLSTSRCLIGEEGDSGFQSESPLPRCLQPSLQPDKDTGF